MSLKLHLGVKTDPIEYRFSYEWLFRLLAEEGVKYVQLGSFFELYQLPDKFFTLLKAQAQDFGLEISSVFTAHRELGGFFRDEPGFVEVARRNYERFIEVAVLLGAKTAGSNPGAILRDQMGYKHTGIACYLNHMKELLGYAGKMGLEWLTIEPMSCLAEPPTLPEEMAHMAGELESFYSSGKARGGFCVDVSHGYANREGRVEWDNLQLLLAALPHTCELHLKNTDDKFNSTFGFTETERKRGIVDPGQVKRLLIENQSRLPVDELIGYFEIGGPKVGRDYSDYQLERDLRESLQYLKEVFPTKDIEEPCCSAPLREAIELVDFKSSAGPKIKISPSMMCADICHLEEHLRQIESVGVDMLHLDVMDAHFVPNMPLGLDFIKKLRKKTSLPFDVHLMVEDNAFFIDQLADVGVEMMSVHAESAVHLDRLLEQILKHGIQAGVALNPATPLSILEYVLDRLDFILLMTVNPGFAGQKLVPSAFKKISDCRAMLDANGLNIPIEVDGNVSFANIPQMVACGGDILVAGTSSLFSKNDSLADNARHMRRVIEEALIARQEAEVLA